MYPTRPRFVILSTCAAVVLCLTFIGCVKFDKKINWPTWPGRSDPNSSSTDSADGQQDLEAQPAADDANTPLSPKDAEIKRLDIDLSLLREEVRELRTRDKRLVNELNQLKFLNTQLQEQVKALADAPGERDKLAEKVKVLRAEIDALKKRLTKPPAATTP